MSKLIIEKDSIFLKIQVALDKRDVSILEGIRYSINMISLSYSNLENVLQNISSKDKPDSIEFYSSFKEVWSIIDGVTRLENLIQLIIKYPSDASLTEIDPVNIDFLREAKAFRNTLQHLDERIDETILKNNLTVWGVLHWMHSEDGEVYHSCTLFPGHVRKGYSADIPMHFGEEFTPPVDKIILESVKVSGANPIIRINISSLIYKIKALTLNFEKQLEYQLKSLESSGTYGQDLFIKMKLEVK